MYLIIPPWALTLTYWLHMLATVVWIGGLAGLAWVFLPAARRSVDGAAYTALLQNITTRLQTVGWFCLAVLGLTGMFQMSASPAYTGFLAINSLWAYAILLKHIVIIGMILVSISLTWGVLPGLQRLALLQSAGRAVDAGKIEALRRREQGLLNINLILSLIVLLLTAVARVNG